jgi:hypothetical protein
MTEIILPNLQVLYLGTIEDTKDDCYDVIISIIENEIEKRDGVIYERFDTEDSTEVNILESVKNVLSY